MILLVTASFIIFVCLVNYWLYRRKFCVQLRKFPRKNGWPFIGMTIDFKNPADCLNVILNYYKTLGNNFVVYLGFRHVLVATEPKLTEFILGSNQLIDKGDIYKLIKRWFGEGLLTSTGNKWRSHRKTITPSFHYKILQDYVKVFDNASRILVRKLDQEIGNETFDVFQYITLCTLDIICETAMGTSIQAQEHPNSEYVRSVKEMCEILYVRSFSVLLQIDAVYHFSKTYAKETKALKVLHGLTNSVIKQRKQALMCDEENEESDEYGINKKITFLDNLLKCSINGEHLSDEDIREEVDTFMFEGHDTTAVSISFTLYLLSKHLDVQEKAYEEIKLLVGDDLNTPVTYEMLMEMKYLEMVIKESLRLYPSVAAFSRTLHKDKEYDGSILPTGLELIVAPYVLHRNPNIFPDPEKFDPERFSLENTTKRHSYAYVPFSAGPRNCIGQKFAMLELKSTISKILRYYKVMPAIPEHTVQVTSIVTIKSVNGIKIRIEKRR